jgi:hypothetical protein
MMSPNPVARFPQCTSSVWATKVGPQKSRFVQWELFVCPGSSLDAEISWRSESEELALQSASCHFDYATNRRNTQRC